MLTSVSRTLLAAALLAGLSTAQASIGARTAEQLQNNYDATPAHCQGNAVPAHACSGVLLRSTKPSPLYHSWHHSQNSKDKGGVSFSYLRSDIPTTRLAADGRSGFTLYPLLQRPKDSLRYEMLCAWPTDGDTWERDNRGCGDNRQTAATEAACHEQGVLTAEQWGNDSGKAATTKPNAHSISAGRGFPSGLKPSTRAYAPNSCLRLNYRSRGTK